MDELELALLQGALLHALQQAHTPEEALALLAAEPLSEPARQWLAHADPRALETALALVQRWVR
jgi:hypothetical protein